MAGSFMVGVSVLLEHQDRVLLLRRATSKDFGAGEWEPVSGRVEQGEDVREAAKREVKEETGLNVDRLQVFDCFYFRRGDNGPELVGITFRGRVSHPAISISDEHDEYHWFRRSELLSAPVSNDLLRCFQLYLSLAGEGDR